MDAGSLGAWDSCCQLGACGDPVQVEGCIFDKRLEPEVNGHDAHELVEWVDRCCAKGTSNVLNCCILCYIKLAEEASLT
jgi:hypothetical protein